MLNAMKEKSYNTTYYHVNLKCLSIGTTKITGEHKPVCIINYSCRPKNKKTTPRRLSESVSARRVGNNHRLYFTLCLYQQSVTNFYHHIHSLSRYSIEHAGVFVFYYSLRNGA